MTRAETAYRNTPAPPGGLIGFYGEPPLFFSVRQEPRASPTIVIVDACCLAQGGSKDTSLLGETSPQLSGTCPFSDPLVRVYHLPEAPFFRGLPPSLSRLRG
jgi:hypothetical protein